MADDKQALESDWIHSVFRVFREEVISIAADFGPQVKRRIDVVSDTAGLRPPSATALLTSVAIETTNMAMSLLDEREPGQSEDPAGDEGGRGESTELREGASSDEPTPIHEHDAVIDDNDEE